MSNCLNVATLAEGQALIASIPARNAELVAEFGVTAQLDGTGESLDRLREIMNKQKVGAGFEVRETELTLKCFGYVATVYENHLGAKAWINPKLFDPNVNYHKRNPSIPRPDGIPISLDRATIGLFNNWTTSPSDRLQQDIERMNQARAATPAPPPWLRSTQYSGTLFVESPMSAADLDVSGQTVGNAVEGSVADWRYRIALNATPDPELISDMAGHPDLQGTMPDLVTAVWELAGEADPDMNHFNDWVHLIQTIENAHKNTAYINNP